MLCLTLKTPSAACHSKVPYNLPSQFSFQDNQDIYKRVSTVQPCDKQHAASTFRVTLSLNITVFSFLVFIPLLQNSGASTSS
jgi:hypothetical protein